MLNNLKPTEGSRKAKTRRCRGLGSGLGKMVDQVQKDKTPVQVVELDLDLKVVNFLYSEDFQKEDSRTLDVSNMLQSMFLI